MQYPKLALLVAGEWLVHDDSRDTRPVTNPATGEELGRLPVATASDVERAVEAAHAAFRSWSRATALTRARILARIGHSIRADAEPLARVLTMENGKPLREALAEVQNVADTFEWMAEECKRVYGRVVPSRLPDSEYLVLREPVGPVGAFTPWNAPAVLFARKIATAMAAGCTVVAKPAEETPGVCVEIARHCMRAELPPGVLNVVFGVPAEISQTLVDHPRIRMLSFTGSVPVGRQLLELSSRQMKRIQLELGGHSPVIVDKGVDVAKVAGLATAARFRNAGQACHGPSRFLVHEAVYQEFGEQMAHGARALKVGNGLEEATRMGPLIHARRVNAMQEFTQDAAAQGARVLCGGSAPKDAATANFWTPTVLADVPLLARAMREEVFGPIALLRSYETIEEAISIANDVDFGLGSYVFSNSLDVIHHAQVELQAGNVSINTFSVTLPEVPFSGVKHSGMGSEMGVEGLLEYSVPKSVLRSSCLQ